MGYTVSSNTYSSTLTLKISVDKLPETGCGRELMTPGPGQGTSLNMVEGMDGLLKIYDLCGR